MNDIARVKLCEIIATYGTDVCRDLLRCEGLMQDLIPVELRRERILLTLALQEKVAVQLLDAPDNVPIEPLMAALRRHLTAEISIAELAAHWAVESWALALAKWRLPPLIRISSEMKLAQVIQSKEMPFPFQPGYEKWINRILGPNVKPHQTPTPYLIVLNVGGEIQDMLIGQQALDAWRGQGRAHDNTTRPPYYIVFDPYDFPEYFYWGYSLPDLGLFLLRNGLISSADYDGSQLPAQWGSKF